MKGKMLSDLNRRYYGNECSYGYYHKIVLF